jgi:hypothetical protein
VIFIIVYHQGCYYVSIADGVDSARNDVSHSLLDHRFPDVSQKSRGYQVLEYCSHDILLSAFHDILLLIYYH